MSETQNKENPNYMDYMKVPANDLDLQMQMTNPNWQDLSPQLREKLVAQVKGNLYEELAGNLGIFTRDIRLGNLSSFSGEFEYVVHYLELAGVLLQAKLPNSAISALNIALSRLETSSSKQGFLRKMMNTIRQERYSSEDTPKKLMGGNKND